MLSALRSTAKIFAPSSAKRTAVARPFPQPGPTDPAPVMIATFPSRRRFIGRSFPKPVEVQRIVDQKGFALFLRRRNFGEQVDQHAVVGYGREVRVRPVAAPEAAVSDFSDELAREGNRVFPGRGFPRDTLRAAHLHPEACVAQELKQAAESRLIDAQ